MFFWETHNLEYHCVVFCCYYRNKLHRDILVQLLFWITLFATAVRGGLLRFLLIFLYWLATLSDASGIRISRNEQMMMVGGWRLMGWWLKILGWLWDSQYASNDVCFGVAVTKIRPSIYCSFVKMQVYNMFYLTLCHNLIMKDWFEWKTC